MRTFARLVTVFLLAIASVSAPLSAGLAPAVGPLVHKHRPAVRARRHAVRGGSHGRVHRGHETRRLGFRQGRGHQGR